MVFCILFVIGMLGETEINYCCIAVDEIQTWKLEMVNDNGFTICGKFEDMRTPFWVLGKLAFPSSLIYFLKPLNEVADLLKKERLKKLKEKMKAKELEDAKSASASSSKSGKAKKTKKKKKKSSDKSKRDVEDTKKED